MILLCVSKIISIIGGIIEIEKLEIPRITESYIINLRFVLNATAPGNVKEIPFLQLNPRFA